MTTPTHRPLPFVLAVLDGLAEGGDLGEHSRQGEHGPAFARNRPRGYVASSGPEVGLPSGWATTRDDAFLGLGAGRVTLTDATRVECAIHDGRFADNDVILGAVAQAKDLGGRVHLIGPVGDGDVRASPHRLSALIDVARSARVRVVVHALLDGRDADPRAALRAMGGLERELAGGVGRIGTVSGRFWGMDGTNWDRVHRCYRAILAAEVKRADSARRGIEESYDAGKTDEVVEPFVVFDYPGVSPVDVAIHFHSRPEEARALTRALATPRFDGFPRKNSRAPFAGRYACLTTHDDSFALPVAWPREPRPNVLPEVLARAGYRQFRCADAANYARVTRLFNGERERPFEGEVHDAVCSAEGVARAAEDAIRTGHYHFVLVHLPSAHLGHVVEATRSAGGAVMVVGDESTRSSILYVNDADPSARLREGGCLSDIAPTLLDVLGLPRPSEMTGRSLLHR